VSRTQLMGIAAVGVAIAAYAYNNSASHVGLQCEIADTTQYYGKTVTSPSSDTKQHTWVLKLSGSTWRLISQDGQPMQEMIDQEAKREGKQPVDFRLPLRTTSGTYVRMEPEDKHDGDYNSKNTGVFIDRVNGTMTGESWLGEKSGNFGTHLTTTGKCSPIDIKANL
jgi:hypothetical protein